MMSKKASTRFLNSAAAMGCYRLEEVTLPEGITYVAANAFRNCRTLRRVTLPSTLTEIRDGAFAYCPVLEEVSFPEGLTAIGNNAFAGCTSFKPSHLPDDLQSIGVDAFYYTAYTNDDASYDEMGVLYLDGYLIQAPPSLAGIYEVKAGTRLIAKNAFYYATSLNRLILPDGITRLEGVCSYCRTLEDVTLPASIAYVDFLAFFHCDSLTALYFDGTVAEWNAVEKVNTTWEDWSFTVYCTDGEWTIPAAEE